MISEGTGDFGEALTALKAGKRVQRAGWNGKGMWIALTPGSSVESVSGGVCPAPHLRGAAREVALEQAAGPAGTPTQVRICPHIDMRAADGSLVIGWLASQTDMLAEDWRVVE